MIKSETKSDFVFVVSLTRSIWRVTLSGAFFGDYRSKQNALKAVAEARQDLDAGGKHSSVVIGEIESV